MPISIKKCKAYSFKKMDGEIEVNMGGIRANQSW